jgi:hypothetical protein
MSYMVGNYEFETEEEAQTAKKEEQAVAYVIQKLDMDDLDAIKKLSRQLQENQTFRTVIGQSFQAKLQKRILELEAGASTLSAEVDNSALAQEIKQATAQGTEKQEAASRKQAKENTASEQTSEHKSSQSLEKQLRKYKRWASITSVSCVTMLLIIIGMFYVNSTSDSPTILNYEQTLLDKYAGWEEDLDAREQALQEKEQELQEREQSLADGQQTDTEYVDGSSGVIPLDLGDGTDTDTETSEDGTATDTAATNE